VKLAELTDQEAGHRIVTPSPRHELIVADAVRQTPEQYGYRPKGSTDWLLVLLERGAGRLRTGGVVEPLAAGDVFLYPPGAPQDYSATSPPGYWENVWVHFVPRPEWLELLKWPGHARGPRRLFLSEADRAPVAAQLRQVVADCQGASSRRMEWARCSLERALLMLAELSPEDGAIRDPRVRRAVRFAVEHLSEPIGVPDFERIMGLHRSQLTALFRGQVGVSPMRFVQDERLRRAAELVAVTALPFQTIAERLGFQSAFYFSNQFRTRYGVSPRNYRKRFEQT
jgi:AraC family transcriptional regulator of arabinose operon